MNKIIISIVLCVSIAFAPTIVNAEEVSELEGKIVALQKDSKAPFSGILLDSIAAAKINTDKKYSLLENQLKLDYELKKQAADLNLQINTLQAKHDSLKERTDSIINVKNEEINRLQELVKEDPNDYTSVWFASGIVAGVLLSIGIFFAAVEAAN